MNAFRRVQEVQLNDLVFVLIAPAHHYCPLLAYSSSTHMQSALRSGESG